MARAPEGRSGARYARAALFSLPSLPSWSSLPLAERPATDRISQAWSRGIPHVVSPDPRQYHRAGLQRLGAHSPQYTRYITRPRWQAAQRPGRANRKKPATLTLRSLREAVADAQPLPRTSRAREAFRASLGPRLSPLSDSDPGPAVSGPFVPDGATGARPIRSFAGAAGCIRKEPSMPTTCGALSTCLSRGANP